MKTFFVSMKSLSLLLLILALGLAVIIPFFFRDSLFFLVGSLKLGWLFSNIVLRLLVIVLFAVFLHHLLKLSLKQRKLKFIYSFLIAILPGFGLSFIYPIYNIDFGMLGDTFAMQNKPFVDEHLTSLPDSEGKYTIYGFFTTTCPHCMEASERLGTNIKGGQKVPVNILFPSTEEDAKKFLDNYQGENFNYGLIDNDSAFITISGGAFPSIFLLDPKGTTVNHWTGDELNYTALDYLKSLDQ
ncbi:MAG: hypothetical protein HYZ14_08505 [Bacteroidetes bacterium]|nr:hypothetical protein [Bacteroidota bacterium]